MPTTQSILRAKPMYSVGSRSGPSSGTINFQPPAGQFWWFKAMRYLLTTVGGAYSPDYNGNPCSFPSASLAIQRVGVVAVTVVSANSTFNTPNITKVGEDTNLGAWASADEYLQISWNTNTNMCSDGTVRNSSASWVIAWLGTETAL